MELRQRTIDIDDFWEFVHLPENRDRLFELIDGEIIEMSQPGWEHGELAYLIAFNLGIFNLGRDLGRITVETGYFSEENRHTLLGPDVAFTRNERAPARGYKKWAPVMPDLAVEIQSPNDSMAQLRRKAAIYLAGGTRLVWLVIPDKQRVEVCRLDDRGEIERRAVGVDGALSGEDVLPGFALKLADLFSM